MKYTKEDCEKLYKEYLSLKEKMPRVLNDNLIGNISQELDKETIEKFEEVKKKLKDECANYYPSL